MKIFAAFPSKYLKAADLHDKHVSAVMSHVLIEEVVNKNGSKLLPILYFSGVPKGMVLNTTNSKTIAGAYGDETDAWPGMPIVLFPTLVPYGDEMVDAIRMKLPSAAERIKAVKESTHSEALSEHMLEQRLNRPMNVAWVPPAASEADFTRAREVFATRKPTPRPKVSPIQDVMHDADGVIWDETAVRAATEEEKAEALRESLQRSNAALDERRASRGAAQPGDGLEIPTFLQRAKKEPEYSENTWIELMQAAE